MNLHVEDRICESHVESDLQLLADRAERLEYVLYGSQLACFDESDCKDLTTRINALSVQFRDIPSNSSFGKLLPIRCRNFARLFDELRRCTQCRCHASRRNQGIYFG